VCVKTGSAYMRVGESEYSLCPAQPDHYERLFEQLRSDAKQPRSIVHLWNYTTNDAVEAIDRLEKSKDLGFFSLLFLTQKVVANLVEDLQLFVVSNGLQRVTGEEELRPEKAVLIGPVKVIPQEYPQIKCRSIDLCCGDSSFNEAKLVTVLLDEFARES